MNDERVSEKVGSVDNHADRKQYDTFATHDCTILRVPPNILLFGDNVQADSAQVTVFDCPPPSIPCIGELPKLKLFHDLSNSERAELEKAEGFETQCTFCDPKNKCTSGAPDHDQHFFDDGYHFSLLSYTKPRPQPFLLGSSTRVRCLDAQLGIATVTCSTTTTHWPTTRR